MVKLPDYVGALAFGIKMGVILPGMSLVEKVYSKLKECHRDGLLSDGDIVCITESVVARAQNNFISVEDVALDVSRKLNLPPDSRVGVVFPTASRNRFSLILMGIARAVPRGKVIVQFSVPTDEMGNQVVTPELAGQLGNRVIPDRLLGDRGFTHPVTGINYIKLYQELISDAGAGAVLFLDNNPLAIASHYPRGVIVSNVHRREATREKIKELVDNCITLEELCNRGEASSEWGLLGSNKSTEYQLKLAPKNGQQLVERLQQKVADDLGVRLEVLIYGDGAYCDPTTGIYELNDPRPAFAATGGLNRIREGIKYKYLADLYYSQGKSPAEIEELLRKSKQEAFSSSSAEREGTTPRRLEDVMASLADLVSGSADAGTPVVLIKGM
ncbi:MAG: hypothetical protein GX973_05690 [Firmicutes bacterium]|nr:hypothetical protein [Bacillota bacterium]